MFSAFPVGEEADKGVDSGPAGPPPPSYSATHHDALKRAVAVSSPAARSRTPDSPAVGRTPRSAPDPPVRLSTDNQTMPSCSQRSLLAKRPTRASAPDPQVRPHRLIAPPITTPSSERWP